ncbi:hypothetical protein ACP70R_050228 [Stipagrostis hirtigluma subsp. patula]
MDTICVGLVGNHDTGKTTLLNAILDNEYDPKRGATVRTEQLSFAHAELYESGNSSRTNGVPDYRSFGRLLGMEGNAAPGHETMSLARRVSFIDCPGNTNYVATMLKGIMMADGVLIVTRPGGGLSQPPALEMLAAAHLMGRSIVVVQIIRDTDDKKKAKKHRKEIRGFITDMKICPGAEIPIVEVAKLAPGSIPSSIRSLCKEIHAMPAANSSSAEGSSSSTAALMLIGSSCVEEEESDEETVFVTLYGRVVQGVLQQPAAGQEAVVEVRPGIVTKGGDGKTVCRPIVLKVASAAGGGVAAVRASAKITGGGPLGAVLRGGLEGHVLGHVGTLPDVYDALKMESRVFPRVFDPYGDEMGVAVPPLEEGQQLLLIVGTMSTYGKVHSVLGRKRRESTIVVTGLTPPTCARAGDSVLICASQRLSWHLIAAGRVVGGRPIINGPPTSS